MSVPDTPIERLLESLEERAKELNCLYRVDEILVDPSRGHSAVLPELVEALPRGWRFPMDCCVRISLAGDTCQTDGFQETEWSLTAPIQGEDQKLGALTVCYTVERPLADEGPFLKEERKLIDTIAQRVAFFATRRDLHRAHQSLQSAQSLSREGERAEWTVILDFLRRTDPELLRRITRRMINYLKLSGLDEAYDLLRDVGTLDESTRARSGENVPLRKSSIRDFVILSEEAFQLASRNLGEEKMVASIRTWIDEERSSFLLEALEDQSRPLSTVVDAIARHRSHIGDTDHLPLPFRRTLNAALLRRLFSDESAYISVAKDAIEVSDMYDLLSRIVYPLQGTGKLGGKSAGLFLAQHLMKGAQDSSGQVWNIKVPKTWHVSSNAFSEFLNYNNLRDLYSRKYMDIEHVRREYDHIVQLVKNCHFPPEISRGLSLALDDLGDTPIIVRSSSLLEDRIGSSFAGKYKSLFLHNSGSREERLEALRDAIAEVYASTFSPDPIEYRAERGLLDLHEEMGIMIQGVVGRRVGDYFLPAFSGVAMSHNEFRWSPRIQRSDGLLRLVPGLGTRAVDRTGDDYPVLLAPGQPGLRVNSTPDEILKYSPRYIDVINLKTQSFDTRELRELWREVGHEYPLVRHLASIVDENHVRSPIGLEPDFEQDEVVCSFDGLIRQTDFVQQMAELLRFLHGKLGGPVDLEFSHDGVDLHILQCRAQSHAEEFAPASIPRDLPPDVLLFRGHKSISNGRVPDISHIVYVDPDAYGNLGNIEDIRRVGSAVGKLNRLLPKRKFVLIGPGRWGSKGDIKLGVRVTYADICNTAVLMEVAHQRGQYVPELSFGTHFFQDLVESDIRYIPLYPEEPGGFLDELYLRRSPNLLSKLLPDYENLGNVVRVIEVGSEGEARVLRVLLNADLNEAVGVFDTPRREAGESTTSSGESLVSAPTEAHWRWRQRMVERIAKDVDANAWGIKGMYVIGSVKNASAGPASDIDLLVHDQGPGASRARLQVWLDGWSRALAEMNYLRTGYNCSGLLDVHFVTDADIERKTSFAAKIGAVTDAARPLQIAVSSGGHGQC